jgi:hypothetical protein
MKSIFAAVLLLFSVWTEASDCRFRWTNNDPGTDSYNFYGLLGTSTNLLASVVGIDSTNLFLTTIPNGAWKFYVTALSGGNIITVESVPSNVLPVSILPAPAPVILVPVITLTPGNYTAALSWTRPPIDYYVTNFVAKLSKSGSGVSISVTTTNTTFLFDHLSNGGYTFSVNGVNMQGPGIDGIRTFKINAGPKNLSILP